MNNKMRTVMASLMAVLLISSGIGMSSVAAADTVDYGNSAPDDAGSSPVLTYTDNIYDLGSDWTVSEKKYDGTVNAEFSVSDTGSSGDTITVSTGSNGDLSNVSLGTQMSIETANSGTISGAAATISNQTSDQVTISLDQTIETQGAVTIQLTDLQPASNLDVSLFGTSFTNTVSSTNDLASTYTVDPATSDTPFRNSYYNQVTVTADTVNTDITLDVVDTSDSSTVTSYTISSTGSTVVSAPLNTGYELQLSGDAVVDSVVVDGYGITDFAVPSQNTFDSVSNTATSDYTNNTDSIDLSSALYQPVLVDTQSVDSLNFSSDISTSGDLTVAIASGSDSTNAFENTTYTSDTTIDKSIDTTSYDSVLVTYQGTGTINSIEAGDTTTDSTDGSTDDSTDSGSAGFIDNNTGLVVLLISIVGSILIVSRN